MGGGFLNPPLHFFDAFPPSRKIRNFYALHNVIVVDF